MTLDDFHPFRAPEEIGKWEDRKQDIRTRILVSAGLLPMPEKTPLRAKRFGVIEREGFKVERVYFESYPGHFVTGSLFSPHGETEANGLVDGKRPGVLCPHGHWADGRFYDSLGRDGHRGAIAQIAKGGERFAAAARNPIIARCVQLARMGCVVFVFDTIGNADSKQLVEHRRGSREGMNGSRLGEWGFVSPQATLRLQTNFGLQTWNSVRAMDFLTSLEEVDQGRLLVTGASGGATQTMILSAIDERVDIAFPAVMVSTGMQGGCTCENSHYLRVGQGNIDIAAAFAPKPLGLTAADDWTVELESKGHPDLKSLYRQLKAPKNYEAHFDIHFYHNFNHVSRTHLYGFVNEHFKLGFDEPVLESDFEYLKREDLSVWDALETKPAHYLTGADHERALNRVWAEASEKAIAKDPEAFRMGWAVILDAASLPPSPPAFDLTGKSRKGSKVEIAGILSLKNRSVPVNVYYPESWNGEVVIHLDAAEPDHGDAAVLRPTLSTGWNASATLTVKENVPVDSWQRSPVYFYGYNDANFTRRAHEVAAAVSMAVSHPDWEVEKISVHGEGEKAALALAAKFLVGEAIDELKIDLKDFRFESARDFRDDNMVPGSVKYGDVEGLRKAVNQ